MNRQLIRDEIKPPKLTHDAIHVWRVSTDIALNDLETLAPILAPDERSRAERFHFERDRRRFVACRGTLRLLAAAYTGQDAAGIRFRYGPQGKPEWEGSGSREETFNVSHSGEMALIAFSLGRPLGVDVELMRPDLDFASLAETSFSKHERAAVLALAPERRANLFFEYWTCKEACIKADGRGLSAGLDRFSVVSSGEQPWREIVVAGEGSVQSGMRVRVLDAGTAGYAAAVASPGAGWDVTLMDVE